MNLAAVMALGAACERSRDVTAVHVLVDPDEESHVEERWGKQFPDIPLVIIDSPYRTVAEPILEYVRDQLVTPPHEVEILVPVIEVRHWYQRPLVNQSLKRLRSLLAGRRHINVVTHEFAPGRKARGRSSPRI